MPPTPVVAALVALVVLIAVFVVLRLKKSSPAPEAPRFEPPRELAPQNHPATSAAPLPPAASAAPHPPHATSHAPTSGQFPAPTAPKTPAVEFAVAPPPIQQVVTPPPVAAPQFMAPAPTPLPVISAPPPTSPFVEEPQENTAALGAPPVAAPVVPEPAETPPPKPGAPAKPRTPLRSYSSIQDTDEEGQAAPPPARIDPPKPVAARVSEARLPATAKPAVPPPAKPVVPEPKVAAPAAAADKVATAKVPAAKSGEHDFSGLNPPAAAAPAPAAATPSAVPASAAQTAASAIAAKYMQPSNPATAELEKGDPRHAAARRLARLSVSEIKLYHEEEVKTGREAKDLWTRLQTDIGLARQTFESRVVAEVRDRFDYLLDEIIRQLAEGDASKLGAGAPALKTDGAPAAAAAPSAPVAEPAKAEARPKPVPEPVKSEPKAAPAPAAAAPVAAAPAAAPAAAAPVAEAAKPAGPSGVAARGLPANPETAELEKGDPRHAAARRLARLSVSEIKLYHEAEVTAGRENKDLWTRLTADISLATTTYEKRVDKEVRDRFDYLYDEILRQLAEGDAGKLGPGAPAPRKAEPPPAAAPAPAPAPAPAAAAPAPAAAPAAAAAPSAAAGIAAKYMQPSNPLTAELEKGDPRHAAARRFARLSVSEIKLYHEDEVKAGREAKDLWTRMGTDIGLAIQTYEKRVDKEVRERFDYLYDEILRQLAEGDAAKLGPGAPPPKP